MLLGTAAHAQLPQPGKNAIAASLVPESAVVVPGETVTLALMMRPSKGWHGYWKNPGDSGIETQIAWDSAGGPHRRADPISGARAADRRRADELRLRGRLCAAHRREGARRPGARAPSCRSARGSIISPAPTRSACPKRRTSPSTWRRGSAPAAQTEPGHVRPLPPGAAEAARKRGAVRARRKPLPAGDPASRRAGAWRALFLPADRRRPRLCGGAELLRARATP